MKAERARASDLPAIRWLLEYDLLPTDDLTQQLLEHFLVCRDEKGVVGTIGLQPLGEFGLLRSLVVAQDRRGEGVGSELIRAAEVLAERSRRRSIYLLTTTPRFFETREYRVIPREAAPLDIQHSAQFSQLCPTSAVLMAKP